MTHLINLVTNIETKSKRRPVMALDHPVNMWILQSQSEDSRKRQRMGKKQLYKIYYIQPWILWHGNDTCLLFLFLSLFWANTCACLCTGEGCDCDRGVHSSECRAFSAHTQRQIRID